MNLMELSSHAQVNNLLVTSISYYRSLVYFYKRKIIRPKSSTMQMDCTAFWYLIG